jgi:hypothetical protein
MEQAFGYVLFGVVVLAAIAAILSLRGDRYKHIGRGGLFEDEPKRAAPPPAMLAAERDDEIRQMLDARNARRATRGQAPLDVEAELQRLTTAKPDVEADPALLAEVRQLVEARNRRRERQGKAPLDVEEEVRRQLRDLGG